MSPNEDEREREAQRLLEVIGREASPGKGGTKMSGAAMAMACGTLMTVLLAGAGLLAWLTWRWFFGG